MATDTELMQAIRADPDADKPRLELAKILTAKSDPLGEFIDLQFEVYRHIKKTGYRPAGALNAREKQMIGSYGHLWVFGIADQVDDYGFRRGFVERIKCGTKLFLKFAPAWYKRDPIRHLVLTDAGAHFDALFRSPHLGRLVSLELWDNKIGDAGLKALAASPHLRKLRWLGLAGNKLTPVGIEALAASKKLPSLQFVNLSRNGKNDPTPQATGDDFDGISHDVEYSALHYELVKKYGRKPWLVRVPPAVNMGVIDPDAV